MTELLQGEDRIAIWEAAGRPMRMGTPQALQTSDLERLRRLFRDGDTSAARSSLEYHQAQYAGLIAIYAEWILAWPPAVADLLGAEAASRVVAAACDAWARRRTSGIRSGRPCGRHSDPMRWMPAPA